MLQLKKKSQEGVLYISTSFRCTIEDKSGSMFHTSARARSYSYIKMKQMHISMTMDLVKYRFHRASRPQAGRRKNHPCSTAVVSSFTGREALGCCKIGGKGDENYVICPKLPPARTIGLSMSEGQPKTDWFLGGEKHHRSHQRHHHVRSCWNTTSRPL